MRSLCHQILMQILWLNLSQTMYYQIFLKQGSYQDKIFLIPELRTLI